MGALNFVQLVPGHAQGAERVPIVVDRGIGQIDLLLRLLVRLKAVQ
jgi:hypothetical protein